MALKVVDRREVNTDVDVTSASTTFVTLATFTGVVIPEGGYATLDWNIPSQSSGLLDTGGFRVQADGVDLNITPRIGDVAYSIANGSQTTSGHAMLTTVNGDPLTNQTITTLTLQGNRSSGAGTVTFTATDVSLVVYGPVTEGTQQTFRTDNRAPMGQGGGSSLEQRGNPYPGAQPYR